MKKYKNEIDLCTVFSVATESRVPLIFIVVIIA